MLAQLSRPRCCRGWPSANKHGKGPLRRALSLWPPCQRPTPSFVRYVLPNPLPTAAFWAFSPLLPDTERGRLAGSF